MAPVIDMDICRSRMLIITIHQDQVVRIWTYARLVCDWTHTFDEEVFSVSIRNYHVLIAFYRVIKIYFITGEKVNQINNVNVRNARQMRFSPSGHLVAVAAGRDIILVSVNGWKIIATLKGHQGTVTSVAWSHDSIYLSTAGVDGGVHGWFMEGFIRYAECVTIGSLYSSIVYDANRKYVYGCGPNIPLRAVDTDKKYWFPQILPDEVEDEGLPPEEEDEDVSGSCWEHNIFRAQTSYEAVPKGITRIAGLFRHDLLCGTNDNGELLLYFVPLSKACKPVWEEKINAGKVICLTTDENYDLIMIASSQGSIMMFTLRKLPWSKDLPDRPPSPRGFLPVDELSLVDVLAVDAEELEEKKKHAQEFSSLIEKDHKDMLYRDHLREQEFIIQMREKEELKARKISEYDLRLRLLEKRVLMTESEKEVAIQGLLESQEIKLKEMNDECEKKVSSYSVLQVNPNQI
ncbi:hypothetical protein M758_3G113600 [Ceratodon purpureus]|uniref:Uncharacterized protein n=1 Tax=Ceratodon purpureus TaxID=3225 RepID=A0A8T0IJD0_CERPU|nr:hypothetical protein KC19_3G112300 [Ceratodon purpureus]KAG0622646.1 hypothetical protein M758_3G113600 [Ceratodon purpureus]